jgi:hypothetical protein
MSETTKKKLPHQISSDRNVFIPRNTTFMLKTELTAIKCEYSSEVPPPPKLLGSTALPVTPPQP